MPRYNVQREDGKWACFSSIVDAYVTEFMSEEDYEAWRKTEYSNRSYRPVRECNLMTVEETLTSICLNRSYEGAIKVLESVGIATPENINKVLEIRKQCYEECGEHDPLYYDETCGVRQDEQIS